MIAIQRAYAAVEKAMSTHDATRGTATKIAAAINQSIGAHSAKVDDPGSVSLTFPASTACCAWEQFKMKAVFAE
jgi:hypothetical protein